MSVQQGVLRPPQILDKEHTMRGQHTRLVPNEAGDEGVAELTDVWSIKIESIDSRLTDLLTRAISGVIHSWAPQLQNAEENVLRELELFEDTFVRAAPQPTQDITQEPTPAQPTPSGSPTA